MRPSTLLRLPSLLAGWLLLAGVPAAGLAAPRSPERGFPLIETYDPGRDIPLQSFDLVRDSRGLLYVANGSGVLVYDGAWWRSIGIGKAVTAFSLAAGDGGRIGVGGVDELGILAPDAGGTLRYVSLMNLLPPGQRELGQVMQTFAVPGGFAFMTTRWLLVWDGAAMKTAAAFPGDRPYAKGFDIDGEIYLWMRDGLARLVGTRLVPVPGGEAFRGRRVDVILPADRGLLVSVREEGLFLFRDGQAVPFTPEASRWTAAQRLLAGLRLPDGRWALGSILGGLLLLEPDGQIDQVIDTSAGLPDDFINAMTLDREGSLWLAMNNGLAKIEVASPLSVLDRRAGLEGSPYSMARHGGTLWVATSAGLSRLVDRRGAPGAPGGRAARLLPVPGIPPSGWSLLSHGEDLLVGTAFGIFQIRGEEPRRVDGFGSRTVFGLERSAKDPRRVWAGTEDGLTAIRREGSGWRSEGSIAGVPREVRSIVEGTDGTLWCGTLLDGVVGVEIPPAGSGRAPRIRRVPGSDDTVLSRIGGRILALQGGRVLRLDEARGELRDDPSLAVLGKNLDALNFAEDAQGNLWLGTLPPSVVMRRGDGWGPGTRSIVEIRARSIQSLLTEPDGTVWLAGGSELFRYAGASPGTDTPLPAPLLSRITVEGDTVLFGGAPGATPPAAELPAKTRRLRIELAPLSFRAGLRYQTRLDPEDSDWSPPAPEPFAELTRLPRGEYTFHARTVGPNGEAGPETAWSFRVLPPWYLTPLAFILWLALAAALVTGYAGLRSRALHHRAARLEAQVDEQTIELRRTVEELRRTQTGLEAANARLEALSLEDDLTGIANRRRLNQALDEEWSRARRHGKPIAFCLLDLDHFKLLNDTRGHPEGDLCLQAVAHYLAGTVRRPGDVVARHGGEEFAVLLPETDLPGALERAEQLRQGIEALAFPHEAVPSGRVTASVGVVALTPAPGQRPEALIEAADLALYRAKTQGRNRVSVGGAAGEAMESGSVAH
ncbi:MAG TPA: diguanylate cyclase [Thermoanaerobaculia bacterium]|nr:diguanylate cyclase [Thermoanaerobaculia bacterium]